MRARVPAGWRDNLFNLQLTVEAAGLIYSIWMYAIPGTLRKIKLNS